MVDRAPAHEPPGYAQSGAEGRARLGGRALRSQLQRFVRRRVPADDVEDVVQTVLCAALGATEVPARDDELRRWLVGIAKHKIADHHRAAARQRLVATPEVGVEPPPYEARAMARWAAGAAEGEYRSAETLRWMAREGHGETLATIAADEGLAPDRVRQRVSRLRRSLRQRWARELASAAGVVLLVLLGWWAWTEPAKPRVVREGWPPSRSPAAERAVELRREALEACDAERWSACLDRLDRARRLDPAGADDPAIRAARRRASEALATPPPPTTTLPSARPTSSAAPTSSTTSTAPMPPKPKFPKRSLPTSPKPGLDTK
ncbi:MAG: sigma-70 family RNA polymerase sigma factor [Deltaproteobacteria bacterium]|nr:sigma-70 family RNA polymerase sigma factor [Deltaproteobacteria bacterium]MBW2536157.1 sigma-70 family RNA polymerase sigma factor [Deltaproteobacteria bacterium]